MANTLHPHEEHGTFITYAVGYTLSLVLTGTAFLVVATKAFDARGLILAIVSLAVAQLFVQLLFFLHLGRETKPRWKLIVFMFMLMVLAILVVGSLWIMQNLNYRMMPPHDLDQHIQQDEGIHY